ncbi:MAG: hypothetical protein K6C98_05995 [Treponema sp.]|nr:hypothetical protein [Treponema sp.]
MKKTVIVIMLSMAALVLSSCASKPTGKPTETSAYKQNEQMGLPAWASQSFKSGWNKTGYYWKGPVDETGFFASGEAKYSDVKTSTSAADLDGKAKIAEYIKQEINATAQQEAITSDTDSETQRQFKEFQSTVASIKISGIMRVDRFIAEDGRVYVLMFVPDSEIKKAVPSDSEFAKRVMEKYIESLDEDK